MRAMLPVSAAALVFGAAQAQQATGDQALERMRGFQTTGTPLEMQSVPQMGRRADQVRRNLGRIKLPPWFRIDLYAVVPDARHMAVRRNNAHVFVGTRKTGLWVVVDRDKDRIADEVKRIAPAIRFTQPNPGYSPHGFLHVVEHNRELVFPAIAFLIEGPDVAVDVVVPQGGLIPRAEEGFNHGHRVCRIGPDNKLCISLGQPFNVQPREKLEPYERLGISGIIRMDRDGSNREVFARGVRDSVGIELHPRTGELWLTGNQVDGMGDDIPPGEIHRATAAGQHCGMPWYGDGRVRTKAYKDSEPPAGVRFPEAEMVAHAAALGLMF